MSSQMSTILSALPAVLTFNLSGIYTNDEGIIFMGLHQFLMNSDILK